MGFSEASWEAVSAEALTYLISQFCCIGLYPSCQRKLDTGWATPLKLQNVLGGFEVFVEVTLVSVMLPWQMRSLVKRTLCCTL